MAAFHDLHHATLHQISGRQVFDPFPAQFNRALGYRAALTGEQVGYRPQGGGFARTIAAQNRHDASLGHLQRHTLEHQNDVVVNDLDAIHVENNIF